MFTQRAAEQTLASHKQIYRACLDATLPNLSIFCPAAVSSEIASSCGSKCHMMSPHGMPCHVATGARQQKHYSGENDRWEAMFSEHPISQELDSSFCCWIAGQLLAQKEFVCSQTPVGYVKVASPAGVSTVSFLLFGAPPRNCARAMQNMFRLRYGPI